MKTLQTIRHIADDSMFAIIVDSGSTRRAYGVSEIGKVWAVGFNSIKKTDEELKSSLSHQYYLTNPKSITKKLRDELSTFIPSGVIDEINELDVKTVNIADYFTKTATPESNPEKEFELLYIPEEEPASQINSLSDLPIAFVDVQFKKIALDYKAKAFNLDRQVSSLTLQVKGARAVFDPSARDGIGAWRCPDNTPGGGQFTNRFGRGCTWGISRRIGRGLLAAADRPDSLLRPIGEAFTARADEKLRRVGEASGRRLVRRAKRKEKIRERLGSMDDSITRVEQRMNDAIDARLDKIDDKRTVRRVARAKRRGIDVDVNDPIVIAGTVNVPADRARYLRELQILNADIPDEDVAGFINLDKMEAATNPQTFPLEYISLRQRDAYAMYLGHSDEKARELDSQFFDVEYELAKLTGANIIKLKREHIDAATTAFFAMGGFAFWADKTDDVKPYPRRLWRAKIKNAELTFKNWDKQRKPKTRKVVGKTPKKTPNVSRLDAQKINSKRSGRGKPVQKASIKNRRITGKKPKEKKRVVMGRALEAFAADVLSGGKTNRAKRNLRNRKRELVIGKTSNKFFAKNYARPNDIPDINSVTAQQKEDLDNAILSEFNQLFDKFLNSSYRGLDRKERERLKSKKRQKITGENIREAIDGVINDGFYQGQLKNDAHNLEVLHEAIESGNYDVLNDLKPAVRNKILVAAGLAPAAQPKKRKPKTKPSSATTATPPAPAAPPAPATPPPPPTPAAPPTPPTPTTPPVPVAPPIPPAPPSPPKPPKDVPSTSPIPDIVDVDKTKPEKSGEEYFGADVGGLKPIKVNDQTTLYLDEKTNRVKDISEDIVITDMVETLPPKFVFKPVVKKNTPTQKANNYPKAVLESKDGKKAQYHVVPGSHENSVASWEDALVLTDPTVGDYGHLATRVVTFEDAAEIFYDAVKDINPNIGPDTKISDLTVTEFAQILPFITELFNGLKLPVERNNLALDKSVAAGDRTIVPGRVDFPDSVISDWEAAVNNARNTQNVQMVSRKYGKRPEPGVDDPFITTFSDLFPDELKKHLVVFSPFGQLYESRLTPEAKSKGFTGRRVDARRRYGNRYYGGTSIPLMRAPGATSLNWWSQDGWVYSYSEYLVTGDVETLNRTYNELVQRVTELKRKVESFLSIYQTPGSKPSARAKREFIANSAELQMSQEFMYAMFGENTPELESIISLLQDKKRRDYQRFVIAYNASLERAERRARGEIKVGGNKTLEELRPKEGEVRTPNEVIKILQEHKTDKLFSPNPIGDGGTVETPPLSAEELEYFEIVQRQRSAQQLLNGYELTQQIARNTSDAKKRVELHVSLELNGYNGNPVSLNDEEFVDAAKARDENGNPLFYMMSRYVNDNDEDPNNKVSAEDVILNYGTHERHPFGSGGQVYGRGEYFAGGTGSSNYGRMGMATLVPKDAKIALNEELSEIAEQSREILREMIEEFGIPATSEMERQEVTNNGGQYDPLNTTRKTWKSEDERREEIIAKAQQLIDDMMSNQNSWIPEAVKNDDATILQYKAALASIVDWFQQLELAKLPNPNNLKAITDFNERITAMQRHLFNMDSSMIALLLGIDLMIGTLGYAASRREGMSGIKTVGDMFGSEFEMFGGSTYLTLLNRTAIAIHQQPLTHAEILNLAGRLR